MGVSLYIVIFSLFHFSFFVVMATFGASAVSPEFQFLLGWLAGPRGLQAAQLACLGLTSFTIAAIVATSWRVGRAPARQPAAATTADRERLGLSGLILQIFGLLLWGWQLVASGGFSALSLTYGEFLATTTALSSWGSWMVGLGFALSPFGERWVRRTSLVLFVLFAAILFPLGLRGTVLFPLAAWLASRAAVNKRTPVLGVLASGAILMVASAAVRSVRDGGVASSQAKGVLTSFLDSLLELGASIYATILTVGWRVDGVPANHFVSFFIVPLRLWERFVLGIRVPADHDLRIFNVEMMYRAGPFGGSPIAEGYNAAGAAGVVLTMLTLGGLTGWALRMQLTSVAWLGYSAAILLPLYINVRNSFASVPAQIGLGIAFVFLAMRLLPQVHRQPAAQALRPPFDPPERPS